MKTRITFIGIVMACCISAVAVSKSWVEFSQPATFTVSVLQSDIDASSATDSTNSLAIAIKRLNANRQLPGQPNDPNVQLCFVKAEPSARLLNGALITICDAYVCSIVYGTDNSTALKILLEFLGIKPSAPYTATLTKQS